MIKGANYLVGDATKPVGKKNKIIAHVCNNIGAWGAGFVMALSRRWKKPEEQYLNMTTRPLGAVDIVEAETNDDHTIYVANMIGQENVGGGNTMGVPPVRYAAIRVALISVFRHAMTIDASVHMPEIGCGLAGGDWNIMEATIESAMNEVGFGSEMLYIYKF